MKLSVLLLSTVIPSAVFVNAAPNGKYYKRDVQYVTVVATTDIPVAQYLSQQPANGVAANAVVQQASAAATVAATPAAAATSSVGTRIGNTIAGWLDNFFGFGSSSSSSQAPAAVPVVAASAPASPSAAAPAAQAPAATAAAVPPTTTSNVLGDLLDPSTLTYTFPGNVALTGQIDATAAATAGASGANAAGGASANEGIAIFGYTFGGGAEATASAGVAVSAPSSTAGYSSPPSASSSGSSPSGGNVVVSNSEFAANIQYGAKGKGVTYSPYNKDNLCKSASAVATDIKLLAPYSLIRLYSTDCSGIENVLASMSSNQQLFLGIWNIDPASVTSGLEDIQKALATSSRGWSAVHTISIGNEQVNAGTATVAQIGTGVQAARQWLKQNAQQYSGSVVSVDTLNAVVANPELCSFLDYVAVNCHPYFTGSISPSDAGSWLKAQVASVSQACGGSKPVLITETGWPTQGNSIGSCVASVSNQASALKSIMDLLGDQCFSFTMYNDYWKDPGPYNIEQHWGIYGDPPS